MKDLNKAVYWWNNLDYDLKYSYFCEFCNRFTRDLEDIYPEEILEIWEEKTKVGVIKITSYNGVQLDINNFTNRRFIGEEIGRNDMTGKPMKEGDIIIEGGCKTRPEVIVYNNKGCGFTYENEHGNDNQSTFSHDWSESQSTQPEKNWLIVGSIYG